MTDSTYRELDERLGNLPESIRRDIDRQVSQAMSYVWGWQDAGGDRRDSNDAWDFSLAYGLHAADFAEEKSFAKRSIQEAFSRWRAGHPLSWERLTRNA